MDLIIRNNKLLIALCLMYVTSFTACNNMNKEYYLLKDWVVAQEDSRAITGGLTLDSLMFDLCIKGCESDVGYTGDFSLKYDYIERQLGEGELTLDLPFVGYKCKNSLIDMFFSYINIEYYNKDSSIVEGEIVLNDSIENFVQQQYREIVYYGDPQPLVNLQLHSNQPLDDLSELLYFVISGYFGYQKQEVLEKLNVDISKESLKNEDIKMFIKQAPLRIRMEPKDKDLYCDE